jgi:site-specific DNA-cytosine methylase
MQGEAEEKMRVLVACEESQAVCKAFRELGHEAFSCDILPCSGGHPEWHIQDDVLKHLDDGWGLMIAHPPCTYLSNAGIGWFNEEKYGDRARLRKKNRIEAFRFVMTLADAKIKHICIENPTGWLNSHFRKPEQIIQPWQFGDCESKRTCLWLKNLPKLIPTKIVKPKIYAYYRKGKKKGMPIYGNSYLKFSEDGGKIRSKTFPGIAKAMASQWGKN